MWPARRGGGGGGRGLAGPRAVRIGWMGRYRKIASEFGYSERADRRSAELLDAAMAGRALPLSRVRQIVRGRTALIAGAGPSLYRFARALRDYGGVPAGAALISADTATGTLLDRAGVVPDIVVTDLDGDVDGALQGAAAAGSAMVVHAHGDNIGSIGPATASLGARFLGTAQCRPVGSLYNFGGFTDGDRCAFLAEALGAARIAVLGMDLSGGRIGSASATPASGRATKLRKLEWARRLLEWLAAASPARMLNASQGEIAGFERASIDAVLRQGIQP